MLRSLVLSARPKQWTKNLLLFAGIVFAGELGDAQRVLRAVLGFAIFCVLSAAGYLVNDASDVEQDRVHPIKRRRPIAEGAVSGRTARVAATGLALIALLASLTLGRDFAAVAGAYLAVTLAYSAALKQIVVVDVGALAAGYVLRAIAGAVAVDVSISSWLLVCTTLVASFVGLTKRRSEMHLLRAEAPEHRRILARYPSRVLDVAIVVVCGATVLAYILYSLLSKTASEHRLLVLSCPFVAFGMLRYLHLVFRRAEGGAPEELLFRDLPLLLSLVLWASTVAVVVYVL